MVVGIPTFYHGWAFRGLSSIPVPLVRAAASLAVRSTPPWEHVQGGTPHRPVVLLLHHWTEHLPASAPCPESCCVFRNVTGRERCRANVALA